MVVTWMMEVEQFAVGLRRAYDFTTDVVFTFMALNLRCILNRVAKYKSPVSASSTKFVRAFQV